MPTPILLYSTNTYLALHINREYYGDKHYVWCSPFFNSRSLPPGFPPLAPSSSPGDLYHAFYGDIIGKDKHSARIEMNRSGLRNGARLKYEDGVINHPIEIEINELINVADLRDFKPMLCIIPFSDEIRRIAHLVPLSERANPIHVEYLIPNLHRSMFDAIELMPI